MSSPNAASRAVACGQPFAMRWHGARHKTRITDMTRHRYETMDALARLGIDRDDIATLLRASSTLSTWAEHECNGIIQRDDETGRAYWHDSYSGKRIGRTSDREAGAVKRAQAIAARYGLIAYHQGDPRGCALYMVRPDDVPAGADIGSYYSRGVAAVPR